MPALVKYYKCLKMLSVFFTCGRCKIYKVIMFLKLHNLMKVEAVLAFYNISAIIIQHSIINNKFYPIL